MSFRNVLFDFDGCLANTLDLWIDVCRDCLHERNIAATREQIIRDIIVKYENITRFGIEDPRAFSDVLSNTVKHRVDKVTLNPYAAEVVNTLKEEGKSVAIVTTSSDSFVKPAIDLLGIADRIDAIVTYDSVTNHKPHPEPLELAISIMGGTRAETIMVGDTRNDILAGKAATVATSLYFPPEHEEIYDKDFLLGLNADYYIRDLREVLRIAA
jgi:pyrophosphatase PpaX